MPRSPLLTRLLPVAVLGVLGVAVAASPALAKSVETIVLPDLPAKSLAPRASRLAERLGLAPLASLQPARIAAREALQGIAVWNAGGGEPTRNGFARRLAVPVPVALAEAERAVAATKDARPVAAGAAQRTAAGDLTWATEVRVAEGQRLRLHLADVHLPPTARLWVYGSAPGEEVAFGPGPALADGELWTPSVTGPAIRLEVTVPRGTAGRSGFTVDQVLESFDLDARGAPQSAGAALVGALAKADTSCLRDAACDPSPSLPASQLDPMKKAIARLDFVVGGQAYTCTGGLLNDTDDATTIPYLLTAHHCIGSQAVAATVEAFFDDIDAACNGAAPDLASLPRVEGATLLATRESSDVTLLQLAALPPGRALLGWTTDPVLPGTELHRLSHPNGLAQQYSVSSATTVAQACAGAPRPSFLYSVRTVGGLFRGSSGAPVVRASDGRVVGQAYGTCGPTASSGEGCDADNSVVDGAFADSFPTLAAWLAPVASACVPGPTTLCIGPGGRFLVEASFETGGKTAAAHAVALTAESGYLWFFDPDNVELVFKVLDGCAVNGRYWVYAAGLTDLGVTLRVTDTHAGTTRSYVGARGQVFPPVRDSEALAACGN